MYDEIKGRKVEEELLRLTVRQHLVPRLNKSICFDLKFNAPSV